MRRATLLAGILVVGTGAVFGGLERGNRLYRAGQYAEAVEAYSGALADGDDSPALRYNLGTALLRLGRYAEAEEHLRAALDVVEPEVRERVQYNLGQRFLEEARNAEDPRAAATLYDAAVEAYRQALRLRPADSDAKWNYELALREREEEQQRQQQAGGDGGGGGGEDPEREDEEQEGGAGSTGQSRGNPSESPSAEQGGQQAPLTKAQAERILSAVEQDERELFQDKLRKGRRESRTARDW